jgi:hypothetical protein
MQTIGLIRKLIVQTICRSTVAVAIVTQKFANRAADSARFLPLLPDASAVNSCQSCAENQSLRNHCKVTLSVYRNARVSLSFLSHTQLSLSLRSLSHTSAV